MERLNRIALKGAETSIEGNRGKSGIWKFSIPDNIKIELYKLLKQGK